MPCFLMLETFTKVIRKQSYLLCEWNCECFILHIFLGTVWYSEFKYEPMVEFGNYLNYTAMGLGNHDFDDSIAGMKPFAEQTNFDLLAANIENHVSDNSFVEGTHYNKSTVKMVKGRKIGIIGYITRSTEYNFPGGRLVFLDEIESVREEAK